MTRKTRSPRRAATGRSASGAGRTTSGRFQDRKDILRFATEPLSEPVGITGKVWVELAFSSDVPDTMFTVKLVDIYPDGYEAVYRASAGLARYWQGLDKPAPLEAGRIYRLMLDCWSTASSSTGATASDCTSAAASASLRGPPEHLRRGRLRSEVRVAHNTIHLSAAHATR